MESPTGIIPEELMRPERREDVVRYLQSLPIPGKLKAEVFGGWAMTVGMKVRGSDIAALKQSGTDGAPQTVIPAQGS